MPPKVKVTKEEIVNTAVELARKSGADAINARTLASMLNCSTQPIFSNFDSMDKLCLAVAQKASALCEEYTKREMASGEFPPYKASGMAYIRFAKEERELFKLLFMRARSGEAINEDADHNARLEKFVQNNTGIDGENVKLFHLEMWAYVHGIATMFATGYLDLEWELVSKMLSDAYLGLRKQYGME